MPKDPTPPSSPSDAPPAELCLRLNIEISGDRLNLALTHRSYAYENGGLPTNERLEFLGDAVLGLVVTDELYRRFPELPEGQLAKMRASVVNMRSLAEVARSFGLGTFVRLGRGEILSGGSDKSSILADTLEALIGACYLEHGIEVATALVHRLVADRLNISADLGAGLDWKTSLQERTANLALGSPEYTIVESGPDHAKQFRATAMIAGRPQGEGEGRSKKEAEQVAASRAFAALADYEAEPSEPTEPSESAEPPASILIDPMPARPVSEPAVSGGPEGA